MRPFIAMLLIFSALSWWACGGTETPIDANTRQTIDSLSTAAIRQLRMEMDSQCHLAQTTQIPHLVDSIKQVRLREIEAQLRTIPK